MTGPIIGPTKFEKWAEAIIWRWLQQLQEDPETKVTDLDAGDVLMLVGDLALQLDPEFNAQLAEIAKRS